MKFFCEHCQTLHDEVAVAPMPPCPIPPALLEALQKIPFGTSGTAITNFNYNSKANKPDFTGYDGWTKDGNHFLGKLPVVSVSATRTIP